ncbi:hypothetical protein ACIA8O_39915 [Kitasatospora sp. NPDC051853]|uniref:hypothetical protein n=1 Tax=Kitasatospora sp. NPDC051853 TaxID=3364058 RepID=UPI003799577E
MYVSRLDNNKPAYWKMEPSDFLFQLEQTLGLTQITMNTANGIVFRSSPGEILFYANAGVRVGAGDLIVSNGDVRVPSSRRVDNGSAWTNIAWRSGWTDFDTVNWQRVQYRVMPDGTCMLRGLFKPTAGAANGIIADLPVGVRPAKGQIFPLACASNVGATLFVNADGRVEVNQASGSTGWLSIGGAVWDLWG